LAPFAARKLRAVRHKRSNNAFMAMAACLVLRLCAVLQAQYVNEGCENSVKSIAETAAKAIDRGRRAANFSASSMPAK